MPETSWPLARSAWIACLSVASITTPPTIALGRVAVAHESSSQWSMWLPLLGAYWADDYQTSVEQMQASAEVTQNFTNVMTAGIGLTGHHEVHDWHLANAMDTSLTFTCFG